MAPAAIMLQRPRTSSHGAVVTLTFVIFSNTVMSSVKAPVSLAQDKRVRCRTSEETVKHQYCSTACLTQGMRQPNSLMELVVELKALQASLRNLHLPSLRNLHLPSTQALNGPRGTRAHSTQCNGLGFPSPPGEVIALLWPGEDFWMLG